MLNINNNINKIYIDLINYYNNEKFISDMLNNKNNNVEIYQGILIDKEWVDKWKKYSFYDLIKSKYLHKNNKYENKIKSLIKEEHEKKNLNYDEINDIEMYIIRDIRYLKAKENLNKLFTILSMEFIETFPLTTKINPTTFYISYQK